MKYKVFMTMMLLFVAVMGMGTASATTYQASNAAWVWDDYADNYGLAIVQTDYQYGELVKGESYTDFGDIDITSDATLNMYQRFEADATPTNARIYPLTEELTWFAGSLSSIGKPAYDETAYVDVVMNSTEIGWTSYEIGGLREYWIDNTNYGIVIIPTTEGEPSRVFNTCFYDGRYDAMGALTPYIETNSMTLNITTSKPVTFINEDGTEVTVDGNELVTLESSTIGIDANNGFVVSFEGITELPLSFENLKPNMKYAFIVNDEVVGIFMSSADGTFSYTVTDYVEGSTIEVSKISSSINILPTMVNEE